LNSVATSSIMTPTKYPCFRRDSRVRPSWSAKPPRSILDRADRIVERPFQLRLAHEQITERELENEQRM
jgi:hypothetical protein